MSNRNNAIGRSYKAGSYIKNGAILPPVVSDKVPTLSIEWINAETDAQSLTVNETHALLKYCWDHGIAGHEGRDESQRETRIRVDTSVIRLTARRNVYYEIGAFREAFRYVTRHRQCKTGLMRNGECCGENV